MRGPVWVVAAAGLVLGFAAAQVTGVRWLGGAVLLAAGAWCVVRAWPRVGPARTVLVVAVALAAFVASHPAADVVGPWVSVLTAAAVLGATTWWVVDRAQPRQAPERRAPAPGA